MKKYLTILASALLSAVTAAAFVSCEGMEEMLEDTSDTKLGIHLSKNVTLGFDDSDPFGEDACNRFQLCDDIAGQCIICTGDVEKPEITFNFSFDGLSKAELEEQRDNIDVSYVFIEDGKLLNVYLTDKASGEAITPDEGSVTDFGNTTIIADITLPEYFDSFYIESENSDIGAKDLSGGIYLYTEKSITAENIAFDDSPDNVLISGGDIIVSTSRISSMRSNVSIASDGELTYVCPPPEQMGVYDDYDTILLEALHGKLTIDLNGNNYTDAPYYDIDGSCYPYVVGNTVAIEPSYGDIEGNFYITNGEYFSLADKDSPETAEQTSADTTKAAKKAKPAKTTAATETETTTFDDYSENTYVEYHFRSKKLLEQHFQKHGGEFGSEFGYETAQDYEKGASDVINSSAALHKTEKDDGDEVYYIEDTNEFAVLSTDGYIRTYFRPDSGKKYYDKQ